MSRANSPARRERYCEAGFTLVELLVVLLVMGIATALVTLSLFESERSRGQRQVERLAEALEHAALAAQWRGRSILWQMQDQSWHFQTEVRGAEGSPWSPIADEPQLAAQTMDSAFRLAFFQRAGQVRAQARLLFATHGINEPFELRLELGEHAWRLRGDALGRVAIESP